MQGNYNIQLALVAGNYQEIAQSLGKSKEAIGKHLTKHGTDNYAVDIEILEVLRMKYAKLAQGIREEIEINTKRGEV